MYISTVKLAFTSLLTSELFGFNFVLWLSPTIPVDILLSTSLLYDYALTSDLGDLFSNAHSHDESNFFAKFY